MHVKKDQTLTKTRTLPLSPGSLKLLNALNSEDRGLKVRFSLATIVFETFELILCQMLSSQGKNAPSDPYPHYLVRLAASRLSPISEARLEKFVYGGFKAITRERRVKDYDGFRTEPSRHGHSETLSMSI